MITSLILVRCLILILALVSAGLLTRYILLNYQTWPFERVMIWTSLVLYTMTAIASSIENMARNAPAGPRTVFLTVSTIWTCTAAVLVTTRKDDPK